MKTIKDVLNFCKEFTFYDHYNIERVIELNHVRDSIFSLLSKCDFIREDKVTTVLGVIENKYIIDGYRWKG